MTAIEAAAEWVLSLLGGSLVTMLMTLAVAAIGFGMLSGRVSARRGAEVVLGCFILVGSAEIARSIVSFAHEGRAPAPVVDPIPPQLDARPPLPPAPQAAGDPFDPYAGREQVR